MNIVAPAGNYEKLESAIKAGANEVYFGLKGFGARRNNQNLGIQEILDGIDYAHLRGVKTLLTLNTLMKDIEIDTSYYNISRIYEHGIDGVIVQDLGFAKFIMENFPGLSVNGSTQMTVANHVEANKLHELGFSRVVLARELSFEEIKSIREKTKIELEVFVSGSLCISYSGNCYISSFIGGRSGNRGLCAYSCRKKFKDEEGNKAYFLSPNDQMLQSEEIKKLIDIGIEGIKVEGRKKSSEYVYETVNYYNNVIEGTPRKSESYKLFNRGYSKGYFYLDNKLMNFKYSSNFGYFLGVRIDKTNNFMVDDELILGDGVQFADKDFNIISGEYVNKILINNKKVIKANKNDVISIGKLPEDTKYIYKNYSKKINDRINHDIKISKRFLKVNGELKIEKDKEIELKFYVYNLKGEKIEVTKKGMRIENEAQKKITKEQIFDKLSELGDTTFEINNLIIDYDGFSFFPFSELKRLKRECIMELGEKLLESYKRESFPRKNYNFKNQNRDRKVLFSALVSNEEQEKACIEMGIEKIYYKQVDVAKENNIFKDNKVKINTNLVSNFYQVLMGEKNKIKGQSVDWNLNIFNNHTLNLFSNFSNIETVFLSPELNYEQLKKIKTDKIKKGLVIYGYLKGMYIEHKIFDKEYKELTGDYYDKYKILKNDLNNIELYLDKPMNLIPKLKDILELDFDEFRLDFIFENYSEVKEILKSLNTRKGNYNPYSFERGVF